MLLIQPQIPSPTKILKVFPNNMKFTFLVWSLCVLTNYGQANVNFKNPEPTPTDKSEDSIWYCFGPRQRHVPYVETAQFPPIIHPKAPWLVLGYTSVYYLLNHFTFFLGRFRLFGHLLHMLMIGIPVGSTLIKFNLGALLHSIGERLPNEWIPDNVKPVVFLPRHFPMPFLHCLHMASPSFSASFLWQ
ncbi:hypothetical protein DSO57_1014506 [Entomophthora muscae]|uniref:Uncharacterized protein n=1 Tax=Entomophthora muscae TaxID=34485 RepID=A0ACC2SIJ2_9FUNG|nr:hypothetical protein DSO57_1014506 [Entomophthora muscae]